jgi:hypothetical protein
VSKLKVAVTGAGGDVGVEAAVGVGLRSDEGIIVDIGVGVVTPGI